MIKNTKMKITVLITVAALMLAAVVLYHANSTEARIVGNTYYVDSVRGNDDKDGKSTATAWKTLNKVNGTLFKPGDKILLKAGGSWKGSLSPKGSGNSDASICIDKYGSGSKPLIHADGLANSAVRLRNQSYWEINNLEITNTSKKLGDFRGISVEGVDAGTLEHIYIKDCSIHNVTGELKGFRTNDTGYELGKRTGGIVFWTDSARGIRTRFNDVLIQNNKVMYCSFGGIAFKQTNKYHWALREGGIDDPNWYPHTNITIRDNYFNQDAENCCVPIILTAVREATIENNMLYKPGQCGIELNYAKNCLVQNNEIYDCSLKGGGTDYCGLDFDRCTDGTLWQYNYINDCGTGILACHAVDSWDFGENNVVRSNIFQNYEHYGVQIYCKGGPDYIENNVFYNDKYPGAVVISDNYAGEYNLRIRENIFCQTVSGGTFGMHEAFDYDNNLYFGNGLGALPRDENKVTSDPRFRDPGKGGTGSEEGTAIGTLGGYRLQPDSPFIDIGTPNFNKYWLSLFEKAESQTGVNRAQRSTPETVMDEEAGEFAIEAEETAYIRSGLYADKNFSNTSSLVVKNTEEFADNKRIAFMKFRLNSTDGRIKSARLLFTTQNASGHMLHIYALDASEWTESGISWNNAPNNDTSGYGLKGQGVTDIGIVRNNEAKTYEVDVTDFLKGAENTFVTFAILTDTVDEENSDSISSGGGDGTPLLTITC